MKLITATIMLFTLNVMGQNPAGWQVVKDKKQLCQIAVPEGWTADRIMPSNLTAPDKKASVLFSNKPASASYGDIAKMAKDMFKPTKTFEETGSRTWFVEAQGPGKPVTSWYVVISSNPVCEAQIKFQDAGFEASAKQMVNSLKAVK